MPLGISSNYRVSSSYTKRNDLLASPTSLLDLSTDSSDMSEPQERNLGPVTATIVSPPIESDDEFSEGEVEAAMCASESAVPPEIDMQAFLSLGLLNNATSDKNNSTPVTTINSSGSRSRNSTHTDSESFDGGDLNISRIGIGRPSYAPSACFDYSPVIESRVVESRNLTPTSNSAAAAAASTGMKSEVSHRSLGLYQDCPQYHERHFSPKNASISAAISSPGQKSTSPTYAQYGATITPVNIEKNDGSTTSDLTYVHDNDRFVTPGQVFGNSSIQQKSLPQKYSPEKGLGLGITPPPTRSKSSRLIVPYVTPPSNDTYTIFILIVQPSAKLFELIRVNYHPATATIGHLMNLIPDHVSEEGLRSQNHVGFCRPHGTTSFSRNLTQDMTASVMARDGTCARIFCGEVIVAIPEGYTGKEVQVLSQHILKIPKMQRLLRKSDPLSAKKRRKARNVISENGGSSLGIQPMSKQTGIIRDTFSSSILFSSPSGTNLQENNESAKPDNGHSRNNVLALLPATTAITSTISPQLKDVTASASQGLSSSELESIKCEAAAAANIAAKKAFTEKMQELLTKLNVPIKEHSRLIQDCDDFSIHSTSDDESTLLDSNSCAYPSDIDLNKLFNNTMTKSFSATP